MIATRLRYHRPASVDAACAVLAEHGDRAGVIGGGTWLLPLLNRHERSLDHVVDLAGAGLEPVVAVDGGFEIAATASYEDVLADAELCAQVPVLERLARGITGGRQIRHQGTLVGSVCFQNPSSEMPAMAAALDAQVLVRGPGGDRAVAARAFATGPYRVDLRPGELVRALRVPCRAGTWGYVKAKLASASWPVATAIAWQDRAAGRAEVTVGAVQAVPLRVDLAPLLDGDGRVRAGDVGELVAAHVTEPWDDVVGPADYRRSIAGVVARRAVEQLEIA